MENSRNRGGSLVHSSHLRFHLDIMIMMLMAGRTEEASRALAKLREEIERVEEQLADQLQDA